MFYQLWRGQHLYACKLNIVVYSTALYFHKLCLKYDYSLTLSLLKNKMREYISGTIIGISQKNAFRTGLGVETSGRPAMGSWWSLGQMVIFGVDIVHHSDLAAEIITCDGEDHGCEPNLTPFQIGGVVTLDGKLSFIWQWPHLSQMCNQESLQNGHISNLLEVHFFPHLNKS